MPRRARGRGVALIFVLWVIALLTLMLGSFALITRTESLQSRHLFDTAKARYAAEAGVNQAVYALSLPDPTQRWLPDGRAYTVQFDDATVELAITDESGLIDLNAAEPLTLMSLFQSVGALTLQLATAIAEAIVDWRDADDLKQPNGAEDRDYDAEGYPYGSKDAPFDTVSEVQQVMGMDFALFQRIEPALTIYSGQALPNMAFAPQEVLQALPNMDPWPGADALIEQRHAWTPQAGGVPPVTPDGTPP
jgi:general secretion pathway protein K